MRCCSLQDIILLCLTLTPVLADAEKPEGGAGDRILSPAPPSGPGSEHQGATTAYTRGLSSIEKDLCYGSTYQLPPTFSPSRFLGKLFFTPTNGGSRRVIIENKMLQDPRFTDNAGSGLVMKDLTEQDSGIFSISLDGDGRWKNMIILVVTDCNNKEETKFYGEVFSVYVPQKPAFVEFTPAKNLALVTVIWNYTDLFKGRGSLNKKRGLWEITDITQEDNGYYKFRGEDNRLLNWRRLVVKEYEYQVGDKDNRIYISYPVESDEWTITFKRGVEKYTLMERGTKQIFNPFDDRLYFIANGIFIKPPQYEDSGIFEFRDKNGNLVQRVEVEVGTGFPAPWHYVIIAGSIFLVIVVCCCVKKCCCKKSSSKRNNPAPQPEAAPAAYYHDMTQPAGPLSNQPASTFAGPPAAAPGGQEPTPLLSNNSDFISSGSDPQFHIKGIYASAPPLSSDTTISDVYTSDKLNIL